MGSKQSVVVPPTTDFFKNCFSAKKIVKKIGHFADFWIFMAIYMDKLDQFKKNLISGHSESVEILPKY